MSGPVFDIIELIAKERGRQERLVAAGRFRATPANARMTHQRRLAILVEEVGEVARAINDADEGSPSRVNGELVGELVQVAAVTVAWLEALGGFRRE